MIAMVRDAVTAVTPLKGRYQGARSREQQRTNVQMVPSIPELSLQLRLVEVLLIACQNLMV